MQEKTVSISEDIGVGDLLALFKKHGFEPSLRSDVPLSLTSAAPLGQFSAKGHRFVLFDAKALRSVALEHAETLEASLPQFIDGSLQTQVGEVLKQNWKQFFISRLTFQWLSKNFPQVSSVHTSAFHDDALFFWGSRAERTLLPSRDRGRFPWAKASEK